MARFATPLFTAGVTTGRAISCEWVIGEIAGNFDFATVIVQVMLTSFMASVTGDTLFANMRLVRSGVRRFAVAIFTPTSPNHRFMAPGSAAPPCCAVEISATRECHTRSRKIPRIDGTLK